MTSFFNHSHTAHPREFELFRGEHVACLQTPARAESLQSRLTEHNHGLQPAPLDRRTVLAKLPVQRCLAFLKHAGRQWLVGALGLLTVFVLKGGPAAAARGLHAVNVIEGFQEA